MSLISWWRKPLGPTPGLFRKAGRRKTLRNLSCRPWVERLEDRLAPAFGVNTWVGGSADWAASTANWDQGHFPTAAEDVQITNGATVTHSADANAGGDLVKSLLINGGS